MPKDQIKYDVRAQKALRGVIREILLEVAEDGLPGEHHFYITFDTQAAGVSISDRLKETHQEEMTVVLQHQFWDLKVGEKAFEVALSFSNVTEHLTVPFAAIKGFFDPSVQFGLQFEPHHANAPVPSMPPIEAAEAALSPPRGRETAKPEPEAPPAAASNEGAEVVELDAFRKKS